MFENQPKGLYALALANTGGSYRVALSAGIDGEFADYLVDKLKMDVYDDDYFGRGRTIAPHLKGKIILCEHNWIVD